MTEQGYGDFRAVSYALRLYSGKDALGNLGAELDRIGARRAFVICGRTVATQTDLLARIEAAVGSERYAGHFGAMDKDSSYAACVAARDAAREAGADLLIALGGGSVIVGTLAVAIFLGENGSPFELMTQYPEGKPAFSPRLNAPKPPIINVPTTPTSAMNRAGTGLKNDDLDHRMEYYDPKTRPAALFWDSEALLSAPVDLLRSTGTTTFSGALRAICQPSLNPLVDGDHRQAFRLARNALPLALAHPSNAAPRIDLCAAAFLANRAADDDTGRRTERDPLSGASYALATAIHLRYEHVGQGEATAALLPTVVRSLGASDEALLRRLAEALEVGAEGGAESVAARSADALAAFYGTIGMPSRVSELSIPRDELPLLVGDAQKNFNANPGERAEAQEEAHLRLLQAAW
jgi:alcohol dehydrogenase class IV